MKVRFIVTSSREGDRDEADLHLAPVKEALAQLGITVVNSFKTIYALICESDVAVFEKTFNCMLKSESQFVPNLNRAGTTVTNWVPQSPIQIPTQLSQLGVADVSIDRQIALTD